MGEPEQAGAAGSPREGPAAARAGMILTPDQRVRVFGSSTLGELVRPGRSGAARECGAGRSSAAGRGGRASAGRCAER